MSFASITELTNLTGSTLSSTVLTEIIGQADREIVARLALAEIGAPGSDDKLKAASLNLSIAGVLTRMRLDGSKPGRSLKIGDISASDDVDAAIAEYTKKAWAAVDSYILTHGTYDRYRFMVRKVNG